MFQTRRQRNCLRLPSLHQRTRPLIGPRKLFTGHFCKCILCAHKNKLDLGKRGFKFPGALRANLVSEPRPIYWPLFLMLHLSVLWGSRKRPLLYSLSQSILINFWNLMANISWQLCVCSSCWNYGPWSLFVWMGPSLPASPCFLFELIAFKGLLSQTNPRAVCHSHPLPFITEGQM